MPPVSMQPDSSQGQHVMVSSAEDVAEFAELVGYAQAAAVQHMCQDAESVQLVGMDGTFSATAANVVEGFARMQTDDIMSQRDALLALRTPSAVLTRGHQGALATLALQCGFMRLDMLALCAIAADEERHRELMCAPQGTRAESQHACHTRDNQHPQHPNFTSGGPSTRLDLHAVTAMHAQLQTHSTTACTAPAGTATCCWFTRIAANAAGSSAAVPSHTLWSPDG